MTTTPLICFVSLRREYLYTLSTAIPSPSFPPASSSGSHPPDSSAPAASTSARGSLPLDSCHQDRDSSSSHSTYSNALDSPSLDSSGSPSRQSSGRQSRPRPSLLGQQQTANTPADGHRWGSTCSLYADRCSWGLDRRRWMGWAHRARDSLRACVGGGEGKLSRL